MNNFIFSQSKFITINNDTLYIHFAVVQLNQRREKKPFPKLAYIKCNCYKIHITYCRCSVIDNILPLYNEDMISIFPHLLSTVTF